MMLLSDPATLRRIPWLPGTRTRDGRPRVGERRSGRAVAARHPEAPARPSRRPRPRRLLRHRARVHRLRRHVSGCLGPRLSRSHAVDRLQRRLRPARLGPARTAAARHPPRRWTAPGMYCEGVKGECNFGQQEIAFRYAEVLETADQHAIYKNGAKAIAEQHGKALTFMAKFNEREGNSCHIHLSVRAESGEPVMAGDGAHGFSPLMGQLDRRDPRDAARVHAALRAEHQLLQAVREGQLRADGRRLGRRQPHLRAARRRPRLVAARREPRARRRRQPVPRDRRDHRRRTARHREGADAARSARRQRVHLGRRPAADDPARGGRSCSPSRRSRATPSATRWSTTT